MGAPIVDIQGAVGPAGISRPKHTRTATGFGAGEIKNVEGKCKFTAIMGPNWREATMLQWLAVASR